MSKKFKRDNRMVVDKDERVIPEIAKARGFIAKPCSACTAMRPRDTNYSRVYAKRGHVRYVKCWFCGNTWSQFGECTSGIVTAEEMLGKTNDLALSLMNGISGISTGND